MNKNPAAELGPAHQLVRLEYGSPACRCGYDAGGSLPTGTSGTTTDAALRYVLSHIAKQGAADIKKHDGAIFAGPTEWDLSGDWNHALKADTNGDPVCRCGWNPANPRTTGELIPATQLQAVARVRAHLARIDRFYTDHQTDTAERLRELLLGTVNGEELRANLAAAGVLPHPNPAPHLTAQQRLDDARAALHAAALEYAAAADALNNTTETRNK